MPSKVGQEEGKRLVRGRKRVIQRNYNALKALGSEFQISKVALKTTPTRVAQNNRLPLISM